MRIMSLALVGLVALGACEDVVDPGSGDPVDLSYALCTGSPDAPSWFAYQDGDGAWTRVMPSTTGAFNFTLASGKGGIAMYRPPSSNLNDGLYIEYATTEEFQANLPSCVGSVRSVSGQVTGYSSVDDVSLRMGFSETEVFGSSTPPANFVLSGVDASVNDLIAARYRTTVGIAFEIFPTSVVIRRNVTGTTTGAVDFSSAADAGAPVQRTLSVTNLASGEALTVYSTIALQTTLSRIAEYEGSTVFTSGATTAPFYAVPATRLSSGESQMIIVATGKTVSSSTVEGRFATSVFTDPSDRSMTLGPALGPVSVAGTSRPSVTYTAQSGYDNVFDALFQQSTNTSFRQVEVLATRGYLGTGSAVTLAVPNLSGVSGFSAAWLLSAGSSAEWGFLATNADRSALNGKAVTYQGANRAGTFTP